MVSQTDEEMDRLPVIILRYNRPLADRQSDNQAFSHPVSQTWRQLAGSQSDQDMEKQTESFI